MRGPEDGVGDPFPFGVKNTGGRPKRSIEEEKRRAELAMKRWLASRRKARQRREHR